MPDTAPCAKCGTDISKDVERCPECSYEPSSSTLGTLFFWLFALPYTVIFGLFAVVSIGGTILGQMSIGEFVGVLIGLGIIGAIPIWYTQRYLRIWKLKPTQEL